VVTPLHKKDPEINWWSPRRRAPPRGCDTSSPLFFSLPALSTVSKHSEETWCSRWGFWLHGEAIGIVVTSCSAATMRGRKWRQQLVVCDEQNLVFNFNLMNKWSLIRLIPFPILQVPIQSPLFVIKKLQYGKVVMYTSLKKLSLKEW